MADLALLRHAGAAREPVIELLPAGQEGAWDDYVRAHPRGTPYHLAGWRRVIGEAYGHPAYYLLARASATGRVAGVLPLVHLKHFLFGNKLVSMPYCDRGGVLADGPEVATALLCEAAALGRRLKAEVIEVRESGTRPAWLPKDPEPQADDRPAKVGMELALPGSPTALWESFKAKLRSQIRRPQKEGLLCRTGGSELLDDFYQVFKVNMRDLGSPVHSLRYLEGVLRVFADRANLLVVSMEGRPVAGGLVIGHGRILANPWASSLREYSRLSPNMLLYWGMLEFACERRFSVFDFGRSTPGGGTHRFKQQWGAVEVALHWRTIPLGNRPAADVAASPRRQRAADCWRRLPVPVATMLGPFVRKHISL